jgi:hypothetical protein
MKIRVAIRVGGSTTQGSTVSFENLVHTEFKIKFQDPAVVGGCATNMISSLYTTSFGQRDNLLEHWIPASSSGD